MEGRFRLFEEPFNLDAIEVAAASTRFNYVTYALVGIRENWDAAIIQLSDVFDAFRAAGRNEEPLDRVFDILIERAMESHDSLDMIQSMAARFGFTISDRVRAAHLYRDDPLKWREEQNLKWLREHNARLGVLRDEAWRAQAATALSNWVKAADAEAARRAEARSQ